ncbi:hypothetical protein GCK72_019601 [Caenorhabditis remanei]|uniref:Sdz-33 F-box domain-containing protein n=1 Tax=Caenorhabditis remanei TaxID=31234 RepID=A0A6A5GED7_CAERE|nr:hypothetical protein GCK72_019601 [Caenorhabditis remanei]KAF1753045.1 hypothetical protein GCK72_019601 [Caenorhabditis remanei]
MCFWNIGTPTPSYPCTLCIIKSVLFPPKKKKPFPLIYLPTVALQNVIKMMNPHELPNGYILELFDANDRQFVVDFGDEHIVEPMDTVTKMKQFSGSYKIEYDTSIFLFQPFPLSWFFEVSNLLLSLYTSPSIEWVFYMDQLEIETTRQFLDTILSGRCEMLTFYGIEISCEFLTELMDKIPLAKRIIIDAHIPSDFRHPNALKFSGSQYKNGRWITLDDLKSVRNVHYVYLNSTIFNCNDINQFLHYWTNCDDNMFEDMELQLDDSVEIDVDVLKNELITLQIVDETVETCFYLKVKNHHNRRFVLCRLQICKSKKAKFTVQEVDDQQTNKFEILELLEKKKNLEEKNEDSEVSEESRRKIAMEIEELMCLIIKKNKNRYIFEF